MRIRAWSSDVCSSDLNDLLETMIEHLIVPRAEACHRARRGAARGELEPVRRPAHDLGGFGGDAAIFRRGLGAGLPGAVHLVAKAPEFDVVRGDRKSVV